MSSISIPDVTAELIMELAEICSISSNGMNEEQLLDSFYKPPSKTYIKRALNAGLLLNVFEVDKNGMYYCPPDVKQIIKRSNRDEMDLPFRIKLQNFAVFLVYIEFLSKGYNSIEAAARSKGIFQINTSITIIERRLRSWGIYSKLLIESDNEIQITIQTENLPAEFVKDLLSALEAELKAKIFLISLLTPEAYSFMEVNNIQLNRLASALINYEKAPRQSVITASQVFEEFLYKFGLINNVKVKQSQGVTQLIESIRSSNLILTNHVNISLGVSGIRNITHHGPDKETGKPWRITPQMSLNTVLMVPLLIKSIYNYYKYQDQEI